MRNEEKKLKPIYIDPELYSQAVSAGLNPRVIAENSMRHAINLLNGGRGVQLRNSRGSNAEARNREVSMPKLAPSDNRSRMVDWGGIEPPTF